MTNLPVFAMSNKGDRVSPDYLADIAPEYAVMAANCSICTSSDAYQRQPTLKENGGASVTRAHAFSNFSASSLATSPATPGDGSAVLSEGLSGEGKYC